MSCEIFVYSTFKLNLYLKIYYYGLFTILKTRNREICIKMYELYNHVSRRENKLIRDGRNKIIG